jgi:hypothetical protein
MNINRKILDEYEHLREIVNCAILHGEGQRNIYFNVLITDYETAKTLLEQQNE